MTDSAEMKTSSGEPSKSDAQSETSQADSQIITPTMLELPSDISTEQTTVEDPQLQPPQGFTPIQTIQQNQSPEDECKQQESPSEEPEQEKATSTNILPPLPPHEPLPQQLALQAPSKPWAKRKFESISGKKHTDPQKVFLLTQKFLELENLRSQNHLSQQDVGTHLCLYARELGIMPEDEDITKATRNKYKQKAKAGLKKARKSFDQPSKTRYPHLEKMVNHVCLTYSEPLHMTSELMSQLSSKCMDLILEASPNYREVFGMKNPIPGKEWMSRIFKSSFYQRHPQYGGGNVDQVEGLETVSKMGYVWNSLSDIDPARVYNVDQTCIYVGFDTNDNLIWSYQQYDGSRSRKLSLAYTFTFASNADGSHMLTTWVGGKQVLPMWAASTGSNCSVPQEVLDSARDEAEKECWESFEGLLRLKAAHQLSTELRDTASQKYGEAPSGSDEKEKWAAKLESYKAKADEEHAVYEQAQKEYDEQVTQLTWAKIGLPGFRLPTMKHLSHEGVRIEQEIIDTEIVLTNINSTISAADETISSAVEAIDAADYILTDLDKARSDDTSRFVSQENLDGAVDTDKKREELEILKRKAQTKLETAKETKKKALESKIRIDEDQSRLLRLYALAEEDCIPGPQRSLMDCRYYQQTQGYMDVLTMVKWFVSVAKQTNVSVENRIALVIEDVPFKHRAWQIARKWPETQGMRVLFLPPSAIPYTLPRSSNGVSQGTALNKIEYLVQLFEKAPTDIIADCFGPGDGNDTYPLSQTNIMERLSRRGYPASASSNFPLVFLELTDSSISKSEWIASEVDAMAGDDTSSRGFGLVENQSINDPSEEDILQQEASDFLAYVNALDLEAFWEGGRERLIESVEEREQKLKDDKYQQKLTVQRRASSKYHAIRRSLTGDRSVSPKIEGSETPEATS